jgi:hypothetical protein
MTLWRRGCPTFINLFQLCLEPDACVLTPCDVNAQFCHVTSQLGGGTSTRTCGPCRSGFQLVGETCVDIQLRDISQENIAFGNVVTFAADTAFIAVNKSQNSLGVSQLVNVTNKIVQVCQLLIFLLLSPSLHPTQFHFFLLDFNSLSLTFYFLLSFFLKPRIVSTPNADPTRLYVDEV